MFIFSVLRKTLLKLGISHSHKQNPYLTRTINVTVILIFTISIVTSFVSIVVECKNLKIVFGSFYVTMSGLLNIIAYVYIVCHKPKLLNFIDDLEKTVEERINDSIMAKIFDALNLSINKWNSVALIFSTRVSQANIMLPAFLLSYYNYIFNGAESDAFELSYPIWLPFDWQTPSGYFVAFLVENVILFTIMMWLTCILFIVIGVASFIVLLVHDTKSKLENLKTFATLTHSDIELNVKISTVIRCHCEAKQLAKRFSDFYRIIVISYFVSSTTNICCALLQVHVLLNTLTGDELQKICINVLWAYGQIFLLCFFGERLSNSFDDLSVDIFHCEWYGFPVKSQRLLNMMLMGSLPPVAILGFGSTVCSRDSFKMMVKGTFSYFMMLRQFEIHP